MDGDVVIELLNLAEKFNYYLYIDEAHATGLGKSGFGITELKSKKNKKEISIGTFSKAFVLRFIYLLFSQNSKKQLIIVQVLFTPHYLQMY